MYKTTFAFPTALILVVLMTTGCSTVTIRPDTQMKASGRPTYQSSLPFFLAGAIGEHTIDTAEICKGGKAVEMQTQTTFIDGVFNTFTLSLFSPRTAKVWCAE